MSKLAQLLDRGEIGPLIVAVVLLHVFGVKLATDRARVWSRGAGLLGFLAYFIWAWLEHAPETGDDALTLVVRALISAGLAYGVSLFALPALVVLVDRVWTAPVRAATEWRRDLSRSWRQRRERKQNVLRDAAARAEAERSEPARSVERQRQREESARQLEALAQSRRRRERARSDSLLYFHLNAPEIAGRFSREQFDEFTRQYLRDDLPPDDVEQHAAQLVDLMKGHLEKTGQHRPDADLLAYARWYAEEKAKIEAQDVHPHVKASHLAIFEERYAQLVDKLLEGMQP